MAKQAVLEGTMSAEAKKIEKLAFEYVEIRDARMAMTREEIDRRDVLIEAMEDAGMETYTRGNLSVSLDQKIKVKVRVSDDEPES